MKHSLVGVQQVIHRLRLGASLSGCAGCSLHPPLPNWRPASDSGIIIACIDRHPTGAECAVGETVCHHHHQSQRHHRHQHQHHRHHHPHHRGHHDRYCRQSQHHSGLKALSDHPPPSTGKWSLQHFPSPSHERS